MTRVGHVPAEPEPISDRAALCPAFNVKLERVFARLRAGQFRPRCRETLRTDDRAEWLHGFGRDYDDGRGIVTQADSARHTWHFYGLAADCEDERFSEQTPASFYEALRTFATAEGLTSGDDWDRDQIKGELDPDEHFHDVPHVQWWVPRMRISPSDAAAILFAQGGVAAVWRAVGAA